MWLKNLNKGIEMDKWLTSLLLITMIYSVEWKIIISFSHLLTYLNYCLIFYTSLYLSSILSFIQTINFLQLYQSPDTHLLVEIVNPEETQAFWAAYDLISICNLPHFISTAMPPSAKIKINKKAFQ